MRVILALLLLVLPGFATADDAPDGWILAFQRQITACWTVGGGTSVPVTVAFSLNMDGTVVDNRIDLVGSEGGTPEDVDRSYQLARRAIIRCQSIGDRTGYDLPADHYLDWRNVELRFDPNEVGKL